MPFSATAHTVNTTGQGDFVVQETTEPVIIDGLMISFDGGVTFEPYTYLGEGSFRGDDTQTADFIQLESGEIYAFNSQDPNAPLPTGNWKITELDLDPSNPPCFTAGTLIETDTGPRAVETLQVGDKVALPDGRMMPILWIGKRELSASVLHSNPKYRPVLIQKDALGRGTPDKDLCLSPQHRIVLDGRRAELMFGEPMVFSAAIHLVNDETIRQQPADQPVTYYHIACAEHVILTSHGLRSESLFLGSGALRSLDREDVQELRELFAELNADAPHAFAQTRLRCLKRPEARALAGALRQ